MMPVPTCLLSWKLRLQQSQPSPSQQPRADASISTSFLTFTVINVCILPHVLALCFLKLHLLWAMIPLAVARPRPCPPPAEFIFQLWECTGQETDAPEELAGPAPLSGRAPPWQ